MTFFLDTNAVIRYLTRDDPQKADRVGQLLRHIRNQQMELVLTHLAIAEIIWVLGKEYQFSKEEIADGMRQIVNTPHIRCEEIHHILSVLDLYVSKNISFIDAYHAVFLPAQGITTFYSYDTDFDQINGITRKEP